MIIGDNICNICKKDHAIYYLRLEDKYPYIKICPCTVTIISGGMA
jgi:hypothetical protein